MMKAMVAAKYGSPDVLQLKEVKEPAPNDDELLIKVYASTVTAGDCEIRRFDIMYLFWLPLRLALGITKPRVGILGQELAGEIVKVGKDVTQFKKGDQVFAATEIQLGAHAEYICLPETACVMTKPTNMTYEEAATIPTGGLNALHFLRKANVQRGDSVLINGAGGSIGTYGVQVARSWGAEVTCVDSADKLEMLRYIGADHVIDYMKKDFTRENQVYDAIIDVVGTSPFARCLKSLKPNGRYVLGNPTITRMVRGLFTSITSDKKVLFEFAAYKKEDMQYLKKLIEEGKIEPVIDRSYRLEQMAEAHRYVQNGLKKGNVTITME